MFESIIFICIAVFGVWVAYSVIFLAPWLPTFSRDMERIVQLAELKNGDVFYELGSGDGRVSLYVAKKNPQAKVVGVEISYILYFLACIKNALSPVKNLRFIRRDIYRADLTYADVVYVFATSHSAKRLAKYLKKTLRSGSRVISYNFQLPFDPSVACERKNKEKKGEMTLYVYDMIDH